MSPTYPSAREILHVLGAGTADARDANVCCTTSIRVGVREVQP